MTRGITITRGVQQPSKLKIAEFDSPVPLQKKFAAKQNKRSVLPKACELDRIPDVGYICPKCKIFVKFHIRQTERLQCMTLPPVDTAKPRKAIL